MSEKTDNTATVGGAPQKAPFPVKRLALSVLAGVAAFALFWCCYYLFVPRTTVGMAELAGTYTLTAASRGDVALAEPEGLGAASVELDADGRCRMNAGERSLSGRWTLDGGFMSLRCADVTLTGTADEGRLALKSGYDSAVTLVFTRAGLTDGSGDIPVGKYTLTGIDDNGTVYAGSVIDAAEPGDWYIRVKRGGSGSAVIFSAETEDISVDGGYILLRGMRLGYTLDGGVLTVDYPGGITLTFEK